MTPWDQLTKLQQLALTHWDAYKDALGVRPRWIDTSEWTEEKFEEEIAKLVEIMDRQDPEDMLY